MTENVIPPDIYLAKGDEFINEKDANDFCDMIIRATKMFIYTQLKKSDKSQIYAATMGFSVLQTCAHSYLMQQTNDISCTLQLISDSKAELNEHLRTLFKEVCVAPPIVKAALQQDVDKYLREGMEQLGIKIGEQ